jgi:zinc protease
MWPRARSKEASGTWRAALVLGLLVACGAPAATAPRDPGDRSWPHQRCELPLDPAVVTAELPNGVRAAWVDLADGSGHVELAFHLAAGSLSEEDDERGSSHLLEHLVFARADAPWAQNAPGAHLSTAAGWLDTVVRVPLPSPDDAGLEAACRAFDRAVLSLAEDSGRSPSVLARARDELAGESREGPEADLERALRSATSALVAGSRLARRGPLAPDVLPDDGAFARWAARWLRPDLITVVVVGDLGLLDVRASVSAAFEARIRPGAPLTASDPGPPPSLTAPFLARQVTDLPAQQLTVASLHADAPLRPSRRELSSQVPLGVARALLEQRLLAAGEGGLPVVTVQPVEGEAGLWGERITMQCAPDAWGPALALCRRVLEATLSEGFDDQVVATLAARARAGLETAPPRNHGDWLAELLAMAAGTAVPMAPEDVLALLGPALDALDGETCRAALAEAWTAGELSLQSLGPGEVGADAGLLLRRAWELGGAVVWAYASDPQRQGRVVDRSHVTDLDVHQLRFANGVCVNLKRVDGDGPVLLRAMVGEGQLALDPEDGAVVFAAQQLGALGGMGLARHDSTELTGLLSAHGVALAVAAGEDAFQLDALADGDGLRLALEALAALLAEPGARDDGLRTGREGLDGFYADLSTATRGPVLSTYLPRLFSGDPRFGLPPQEQVEAVTMDDVSAWVLPQFADGPVELTLVGPFETTEAEALVAATFGLLPPRRATLNEHADRRRVTLAHGLTQELTVAAPAPRALVQVHLPTEDGRDARRRRQLALLAAVVDARLAQELEPLLGPAGRLEVSSSASQVFAGLGDLRVELEPPAGQGARARDACLTALQRLAAEGLDDQELARVAAPRIDAVLAQQRSAGFWLGVLGRCQREPQRLDDARRLEADYRELTAADLSALARQVLDLSAASWVVVEGSGR